jgi:hypothetical protein
LWFAEDVASAPAAIQFAQQCAKRGQHKGDAFQASAPLLLQTSLDPAVRAAKVQWITEGAAGVARADDQRQDNEAKGQGKAPLIGT